MSSIRTNARVPVHTNADRRVGGTAAQHRGPNGLARRTVVSLGRGGPAFADSDGNISDGSISDYDDYHKDSTIKGRSPFEMVWVTKYDLLLFNGYKLRPRYKPNWTPSWEKTGQWPQECEDYHRELWRPNIIDATRITDDKLVYIKRIPTGSREYTVAKSLSGLEDPANHTVPILDCIEDDENPDVSYMVMPFLRATDNPPFELVDDITDIVGQLLEGLVFMHGQGVAHQGTAYKNIMMDGTSLYPKGFHPIVTNYTPDVRNKAKPYARFTAPTPVKYYFVNFGISESLAVEGTSLRASGTDGLGPDVPELSGSEPYDPFKVDIFILGNFFKKYLFDRYSNVEFLAAFVENMTKRDPDERPDAEELKARWQNANSAISLNQRTQYLVERTSGKAATGSFFLPFLYAGPILLVQGWFTNARWTRFLRKQE